MLVCFPALSPVTVTRVPGNPSDEGYSGLRHRCSGRAAIIRHSPDSLQVRGNHTAVPASRQGDQFRGPDDLNSRFPVSGGQNAHISCHSDARLPIALHLP